MLILPSSHKFYFGRYVVLLFLYGSAQSCYLLESGAECIYGKYILKYYDTDSINSFGCTKNIPRAVGFRLDIFSFCFTGNLSSYASVAFSCLNKHFIACDWLELDKFM